MRSTITVILIFFSLLAVAQKPVSQCDTREVFGNRGEIYFILKGASSEVQKLTRIISIDNVKEGDVYAYASVKEFEALKAQFDFYFIQLPKPSEMNIEPMSNSSRDVLDWNYYPTYPAYLQIMQDFATNFPEICNIDTIGVTNENRLIIVARISDNVGVEEDEPEFLYTSSMHGDETTGYPLMLHLIDYLLTNYGIDSRVTSMVNSMDIWINPLANPDGTYAGGDNSVNGATRYNANYIDLNRNYPDPEDGPHPDGNPWQIETIAFMNFAEGRDFVMSANFHGGAEVVNYPWDTWIHLNTDDNWWQLISREYADTVHANAPFGYMTFMNNGITNGYAWYRITGGRQDYMNFFQQCREFTVEISDTKLLPANQLINHWNYNYRSFLNHMEQATYGVRGIITDTITGEPIHAQVYISGHDQDSSMVFSSVPVGNYHRPIKAGTYNITYFADGYMPKTVKNVVVNDHAATIVNVRLWNGTPIPSFTSSDTLIAPGRTVQFFDNSGGSPTSRLWTFEGGTPASSTDQNPEITYTQEGEFNVTLRVTNIIGSNTLVKEDYIEVREGVGVKDQPTSGIRIYPNPVKGDLLSIESPNQLMNCIVSDLSGKHVLESKLTGNNARLNISGLKNGLYMVEIKDTNGAFTTKVMISR